MEALIHQNLSTYNMSGQPPVVPKGSRGLGPGQVEDDASIQRGTSDVRTNAAMLARVRAARPDAVILWKPHPDVGKGLRKGAVAHPEQWADMTLPDCDITQVLDQVDEVWTMTSGTGFEALLRRVKVTTLGTPFYAGWGLTDDLAPVPERRLHGPRPTLEALVHAALIDYPRYYDPVTGQACPVEVTIDRLVNGPIPTPGPVNRLLSKGQGFLATHTRFWLR
jgi:capsular polysaccharide export protein